MKISHKTRLNIAVLAAVLAAGYALWLLSRRPGEAGGSGAGPHRQADALRPAGTGGGISAQLGGAAGDERLENAGPVGEIRQEAARRAQQIRAAQEQLRSGANPEDVKAPELPPRRP